MRKVFVSPRPLCSVFMMLLTQGTCLAQTSNRSSRGGDQGASPCAGVGMMTEVEGDEQEMGRCGLILAPPSLPTTCTPQTPSIEEAMKR